MPPRLLLFSLVVIVVLVPTGRADLVFVRGREKAVNGTVKSGINAPRSSSRSRPPRN